ncbi:hypothetical protein HCH_06753 [Hahella chejuensis KCTC 2396]|uniref:Uncharacterized protein n=1 Tax=Hahella chejuensis (strain KCTC 2396) TaxID=349521 RepID=Q2S7J6_HAHCH|nr:hypothetical protein [Hahella chejuensis]ABC33378.1 hypothetical protein HCH_06753 [Hahella chejuensis KCTC 2396]
MMNKGAISPTLEAPLCPMETWAAGICNGLAIAPGMSKTLNSRQALRCWVHEAKTKGRLAVLETLGRRHYRAPHELPQATPALFFYWSQAVELLGENAFAIQSMKEGYKGVRRLEQIGLRSPAALNAALLNAKRRDQILLATMASLLKPVWGTLLVASHGVCSQSDLAGGVLDSYYESVIEGLLI